MTADRTVREAHLSRAMKRAIAIRILGVGLLAIISGCATNPVPVDASRSLERAILGTWQLTAHDGVRQSDKEVYIQFRPDGVCCIWGTLGDVQTDADGVARSKYYIKGQNVVFIGHGDTEQKGSRVQIDDDSMIFVGENGMGIYKRVKNPPKPGQLHPLASR